MHSTREDVKSSLIIVFVLSYFNFLVVPAEFHCLTIVFFLHFAGSGTSTAGSGKGSGYGFADKVDFVISLIAYAGY